MSGTSEQIPFFDPTQSLAQKPSLKVWAILEKQNSQVAMGVFLTVDCTPPFALTLLDTVLASEQSRGKGGSR
jgi:hypothetical protein